jgi:hypothetical protein
MAGGAGANEYSGLISLLAPYELLFLKTASHFIKQFKELAL